MALDAAAGYGLGHPAGVMACAGWGAVGCCAGSGVCGGDCKLPGGAVLAPSPGRAAHCSLWRHLGRLAVVPSVCAGGAVPVLAGCWRSIGAVGPCGQRAGIRTVVVASAAWPPRGREGKESMVASSGLAFMVSVVAARLQGEFNKPVLAHSAFAMAGTYSAAQRFVDLACMPLIAMQEALWPRLYAHDNPMRALIRTGACLLGLALACAGFLWMAGPLLPWLLGADYASAAWTLQWLALLPMLQTLRSLLSFHWIHHGRMQRIGWSSMAGAGVGLMALTYLVQAYGLGGAVVATYLCEIVMIIILLVGIQGVR